MSKQVKKIKTVTKKQLFALKPYLDELAAEIENPAFVDNDPVQFMHAFEDKNDMELAGFLVAIMAWGRRSVVISKFEDLLKRMDYRPAEFIGNFTESEADVFTGFKHRTFKAIDMYWLTRILQIILLQYGNFEQFWIFCHEQAIQQKRELLGVFHEEFFALLPETAQRSRKHISNPENNSACKRLNMFLRWCTRKSSVDLGTMSFLKPSDLVIPMDVHAARQARKLGLLGRKQTDWKAVQELQSRVKLINPDDPAAYDFALFGIGVNKREIPDEFLLNKTIE